MRFASFAIVLGFLTSGLVLRPAFAATSTASFGVSAIVQSSCQASTPVSAFGNAATTGGSPVSVTCSIATPYNVSFSPELTASAIQKTTAPAKTLAGFALSPGSARVFNHGRVAGANSMAGAGNGFSHLPTVYGQSAWAQNVAPGAFADSVTVTVIY